MLTLTCWQCAYLVLTWSVLQAGCCLFRVCQSSGCGQVITTDDEGDDGTPLCSVATGTRRVASAFSMLAPDLFILPERPGWCC